MGCIRFAELQHLQFILGLYSYHSTDIRMMPFPAYISMLAMALGYYFCILLRIPRVFAVGFTLARLKSSAERMRIVSEVSLILSPL